MRIFFLACVLALSSAAIAQSTGPLYVAAKTGLSIREKPEAGAKVLDKIPYGTKISLINEDEGWVEIITEGMTGNWRKVKYNNKTGYIVDSYLFPFPPPKQGVVKEMKQYLAQISQPFGARLVVKSGSMNQIDEGGWQINKQLYKNGAEWHENMGYEYGSDTYFLPGFSMQQGFLLLRLIPEFSNLFGEKDEFPTESKKYKKGQIEYDLKIDKETPDTPWYEKITITYEDGAYYDFEMFLLDNQLVIMLSSGI